MKTTDIDVRYARCREALERHGQAHVLRFWDELSGTERLHLLGEIEAVPWDRVQPLIETHVRRKPAEEMLSNLEPPPFYPLVPRPDQEALYRDAARCGSELLSDGKVAAFTVAGGQGSRLGFDGPKGAVPVSPVRRKPLFQLFAEALVAVRERHGADIRWYIMTSPANHDATLAFLAENAYFGLPEDDVVAFEQGMLPSFHFDGKLVLQDRHRLALAPDGHGGSLRALEASGALDDMQSRDIEILSYFQVDNPLVKPFDPLFIGLHSITASEMSSKVARKADDLEKVGNLCVQNGRLHVIEYSDFPPKLAHATLPPEAGGGRKFDLGNLAIHLLDVDFAKRLGAHQGDDAHELPYHRAEKKVSCLDDAGVVQTPREPNAVKLETFVFDALPLAENPLLLEIDRAQEFSPVKNPDGVDSVESATRDQVRRAADWLEAAGAAVPRDESGEPAVVVEIAASYALDADDVRRRVAEEPVVLEAGAAIYLD